MPPHASSFPLSNSRILPLPSPLLANNFCNSQSLPGITTPQQYHTSPNDHSPVIPLTSGRFCYSHFGTLSDGYFSSTPAKIASRTATKHNVKPSLHSISSLLSSSPAADLPPEKLIGSPSSPYFTNCYWSGTSPITATAITPRASAVANSISVYGRLSEDYGSDTNSYTSRDYPDIKEGIEGGVKRKMRSCSRTSSALNSSKENGINNKDDEYDVLGRKKPKTPRTPMSWDPSDDILLKELKEEQRLGWKEIATHFPGRTSHACQFRWRRLVSGTLKYYQGHRRPPVVTTTSSSFASEVAVKTAAAHSVSGPPTPAATRFHPVPVSPALSTHHHAYDKGPYPHRTSFSGSSFSLPSPASSSPQQHGSSPVVLPGTPQTPPPPPYTPGPYPTPSYVQSPFGYPGHPHYLPTPAEEDEEDDENWTREEDALLMDRKLCFDEVNVLLPGRREPEIWRRMGKLRWGRGGSESSGSGESDLGISLADMPIRGVKLPPVTPGMSSRSPQRNSMHG